MNKETGKRTWIQRIALALACVLGITSVLSGLPATELRAQEEGEAEELKVMETFPVNGGQDVLLSSGMEITFNSETVSGTALAEAVSISPEMKFYVQGGADSRTLVIAPYGEFEPETQYTVTVQKGLTSGDGEVLQEDVTFSFITASEDLSALDAGISIAPAGQGCVVNALTSEIPAFFLMIAMPNFS